MAPGDRAKAGVLKRIAASAHTITVVYPPKRVLTTGTAALPIAPLTGPLPATTLIPGAAPTPEKSPVTMQCLWYDTPTTADLASSHNRRSYSTVGWRAGATAMIRVAVTDAALDPTKPYERTVFDECESVQHFGVSYKVLGVTRTDAGFAEPYSYYVWLSTSEVL